MAPLFRLVFPVIIVLIGCSTEDRVQVLSDEAEIIRTINTLFIETDNRNWDKVQEVFSDTVLFDMTSVAGGQPAYVSSQHIVDGWDRGLKPLQAIHHQAGNYIVTVKDQQAEVFCYAIASHYLPNPTNRNTRTFVGSYNIHLERRGWSWLIDRFKFNLKYIDGNKDLTGPAK